MKFSMPVPFIGASVSVCVVGGGGAGGGGGGGGETGHWAYPHTHDEDGL